MESDDDVYRLLPLHQACVQGNTRVVNTLLGLGYNPNEKDGVYGKTPLHLLACVSQLSRTGEIINDNILLCLDLLLQHGADPSIVCNKMKTALHYACMFANYEFLMRLLNHGNVTDFIDMKDEDDETALIKLAFRTGPDIRFDYGFGFEDIAEKMIILGANVNYRNRYGSTAIMGACTKGDKALIRVLLDNGANINMSMEDGVTPLHLFCGSDFRGKRLPLIRFLIQQGANIDAIDTYGNTPLAYFRGPDRKAVDAFLKDWNQIHKVRK